MENLKLTVSSTPHIRSNDSIQGIMRDVLIALTPASLAGIFFFGWRALAIIILSIASCIVFEGLYQKIAGKPITITDLSAAVTGLLLAMNLPSSSPFWLPIVGGFVAIVVVKQLFGGLGQNFMNPALAARAFLLASYPVKMTDYMPTNYMINNMGIDSVTYATPLSAISEGTGGYTGSILDALLGNVGGCIGETCAIALILGGVYLLVRKVISWRIPTVYILTVFAFMLIFKGSLTDAVHQLFLGGLMLGAFFMATDYSSSPVTPLGQLIMGFGCGALTSIIRLWGGYPEGVSYSILLMNLCVPLIDRYTKPRKFGEVKKNA